MYDLSYLKVPCVLKIDMPSKVIECQIIGSQIKIAMNKAKKLPEGDRISELSELS